jgi:hypothetical protein
MTDGALLIVIGLITIIWGHWLAPRQLEKVRERATLRGGDRYDRFVKFPAVSRFLRVPLVVGCVVVFIGLVYVIVEL